MMAAIKTAVIIPSWNEKDALRQCLKTLAAQSQAHTVVVVDNGSRDGSAGMVATEFPDAVLIRNKKNLGFTGGVNPGLTWALDNDFDYAGLLNNDAIADKKWLGHLVGFLDAQPKAGIVTSKICDADKTHLDSTGDIYTVWGLPYPRGRGEGFSDKYDNEVWVFGASGGASLYRVDMLRQIGLFDQKFFAYYEDIDISFRAQLAGWKVGYEPRALVFHAIGATSGKIKGFTTYHTIKNLPMVLWKDVPGPLLSKILPRLLLAHTLFIGRALSRGQIWPVMKGVVMATVYFPGLLRERHRIQAGRRVSIEYINSLLTHDLPPNAHNLRRLRSRWWKLVGRTHG